MKEDTHEENSQFCVPSFLSPIQNEHNAAAIGIRATEPLREKRKEPSSRTLWLRKSLGNIKTLLLIFGFKAMKLYNSYKYRMLQFFNFLLSFKLKSENRKKSVFQNIVRAFHLSALFCRALYFYNTKDRLFLCLSFVWEETQLNEL